MCGVGVGWGGSPFVKSSVPCVLVASELTRQAWISLAARLDCVVLD